LVAQSKDHDHDLDQTLELRNQAEATDANDVLYSLKSSADYNPEPGLASIKTKVFALNFC
jgi:homoserine O-acetyltransferase